MALALNNLKRVDMPLNKETKPNLNNNSFKYLFLTQIIWTVIWYQVFLSFVCVTFWVVNIHAVLFDFVKVDVLTKGARRAKEWGVLNMTGCRKRGWREEKVGQIGMGREKVIMEEERERKEWKSEEIFKLSMCMKICCVLWGGFFRGV